MANVDHLELLRQGAAAWNAWRAKEPSAKPDLFEANLSEANLSGANLSEAELSGANLLGANLMEADLSGANLSEAYLSEAYLLGANLMEADLSGAHLSEANLFLAKLMEADLSGAHLMKANLTEANLSEADLSGVDLFGAHLAKANLREANLSGADLRGASLLETDLSEADLTGCRIYGMSAWDLNLQGTKQNNLVITREGQPEVTVDNIEVAQFIYLLLHNEKIRNVIDTITTKVVLILGRFTPDRKKVLDALRDELRQRNRTPIVFDFSGPRSKNTTDTVKLLAQMARYVVVDLSDPNSAPYELGVISMLGLETTPVVPIIVSTQKPFPMLDDVLEKRWSTDLITYRDLDDLRAILDVKLVSAAEAKVLELRRTKPG